MKLYMFISGIAMISFAMAALIFWRFYRNSRDRFFLYFTAAFALLAFENVLLTTRCQPLNSLRTSLSDHQSWIYLIRLLAFIMITAAVISKNRRRS